MSAGLHGHGMEIRWAIAVPSCFAFVLCAGNVLMNITIRMRRYASLQSAAVGRLLPAEK